MDTETEQRIKKLEREIAQLKSFTTIPFEVEGAFKTRLGIAELARISVSTKGVDTEDVTVNEAGASSYAVMNDPDIFLQLSVSGTTYYIPAFT